MSELVKLIDLNSAIEPTTQPLNEDKEPKRIPNSLTFRLEYYPEQNGLFGDEPRPAPQNGWERIFVVFDKITLEQFASIILDLLGWEQDHLYEFKIHNKVYADMGESDYFINAVNPCVSCAIPLFRLGLVRADTLDFIFDFGDLHLFQLTVNDIRPYRVGEPLSALISYKGKNILQYPSLLSRKDTTAFANRPPTINPKQQRDMGDPLRIRFVRGDDSQILEKWRTSNDKRLFDKAVTILENRNLSVKHIAEKTERSVSVIRSWIAAFNHHGIAALDPPRKKRSPGEREAAANQKQKRLLEILHDRPKAYGVNRASWNIAALAAAYSKKYGEQLSRSTVSRMVQMAGFKFKKARCVLTSPDPEYREKVEQVLGTLQNLKNDELFFFIDELGPLRVKKYGGRIFAAKDDVPTFPQVQTHKGSITMAGALSATTNQVTWLFSPAKDTQSMIDLIEILFNQNPLIARIYLTWDAASWHSSFSLIEWLDSFNAQTSESCSGPIIQLVPLPTSSQFLDVLEAVFSGMKRAVVHHSNYRSDRELKTAISEHFTERNAFFKENPKRAGNKIWEVNFFQDTNNLRSGNYREW